MIHKIYFDGGTALNAICIYDEDRKKYFVSNTKKGLTNNTLEYMALLKAVKYAHTYYGITSSFVFCGDSELIIKQMNNEYAVKKLHLKALKDSINGNLVHVTHSRFEWVSREQNKAGIVLEQAMLLTRKHLYE